MTKRNYIALGLIILIIFLGLGLYVVLTTGKSAPIGEAIRNILPFGRGENINIPSNNGYVGTTTPAGSEEIPRFFQVSSDPVAGYAPLIKNGFEAVRYVERATGHIVDVQLDTLGKTKISNKTMPKIYQAIFKADGSKVIYRGLPGNGDVVDNISLTLIPPRATSTTDLYTTQEVSLRSDITDMAVGNGETLFFVSDDANGIFSTDFQGNRVVSLFSSQFTGWNLAPIGSNLLIYTKPDSTTPSFAYILNTTNRSLSKLFGPMYGLTIVPSGDGTKVLFSFISANETNLVAQDVRSGDDSIIEPSTLAEKCVWSKLNVNMIYCGVSKIGSNEPELWHRGVTHYSDVIWSFNTTSELSFEILEPKKDFGVDIDVVEPKLSIDENYLLFINKNDLTLWALKLE